MRLSRSISALSARTSFLSFAAPAAIAALIIAGCGGSSHHKQATSSSSGATPTTFTSHVFASGVPITHSTPAGVQSINQPDDMTQLGGKIYVGFQNNVGPDGTPTPKGSPGAGNLVSTVVEFSSSGSPITHWNIAGHIDGIAADTAHGNVIATTNEDANAHLFVISPGSAQAVSYKVPALPHNGGLDSVSFWKGMMLISASAPGTSGKAAPQRSYPAVYVASLNSASHAVSVHELFGDEATATKANSGSSGTTHLALVDPDSNTVVPSYAPHFGGDFELTSQGDQEQIFVGDSAAKQLSVMKLSQSIDDTAWASGSSGTLYVADNSADLIYKITGPFKKGQEVVSVTPCDAGNAPASCPAPPKFPSNYLGLADAPTGAVTKLPLGGTTIQPKGLMFVP